MDPDELCTDGTGCWHPPDNREYQTSLDDDGTHVLWSVDCGECGERLAQGSDRV